MHILCVMNMHCICDCQHFFTQHRAPSFISIVIFSIYMTQKIKNRKTHKNIFSKYALIVSMSHIQRHAFFMFFFLISTSKLSLSLCMCRLFLGSASIKMLQIITFYLIERKRVETEMNCHIFAIW
jgi:hypothetical protein